VIKVKVFRQPEFRPAVGVVGHTLDHRETGAHVLEDRDGAEQRVGDVVVSAAVIDRPLGRVAVGTIDMLDGPRDRVVDVAFFGYNLFNLDNDLTIRKTYNDAVFVDGFAKIQDCPIIMHDSLCVWDAKWNNHEIIAWIISITKACITKRFGGIYFVHADPDEFIDMTLSLDSCSSNRRPLHAAFRRVKYQRAHYKHDY